MCCAVSTGTTCSGFTMDQIGGMAGYIPELQSVEPTAGPAATVDFGARLARGAEGSEVRSSLHNPAHGVVVAPAELLGAPSPRALDPFKQAEPDLKEVAARLARAPCGLPDVVRPIPHRRQG